MVDIPCVLFINKYYIVGYLCLEIFSFILKPVKCHFNKEVIEVKEFNGDGRDTTEKEDIGHLVFQSAGR